VLQDTIDDSAPWNVDDSATRAVTKSGIKEVSASLGAEQADASSALCALTRDFPGFVSTHGDFAEVGHNFGQAEGVRVGGVNFSCLLSLHDSTV